MLLLMLKGVIARGIPNMQKKYNHKLIKLAKKRFLLGNLFMNCCQAHYLMFYS